MHFPIIQNNQIKEFIDPKKDLCKELGSFKPTLSEIIISHNNILLESIRIVLLEEPPE